MLKKGHSSIVSCCRQTNCCYRTIIFGLQEMVSRPYMPVLMRWKVKSADTRLKTHPVEFRELFGAPLRFLGSQFDFYGSPSGSPQGLGRENWGSK